MICLDSDAAVAAFQKTPPANIAVFRDRVHFFLRSNSEQRIMFPAIALSEYLWKADLAELETAIQRVVGGSMFAPPFNPTTATISAELGRRYANGRKLGDVAKETNHDRVALKLDLLIVATALEHQPRFFLTRDTGCHELAKFAGLDSRLINELPDPPPPSPPASFSPAPPAQRYDLFSTDGAKDEGP